MENQDIEIIQKDKPIAGKTIMSHVYKQQIKPIVKPKEKVSEPKVKKGLRQSVPNKNFQKYRTQKII